MRLTLHKLSRGAMDRLVSSIERSPNAEPWDAEVEEILFDGIAASHLYEKGSALLLADDGGQIIGAALHFGYDRLPGAQYIAAILVDHRYRRRGYGRELLRVVVEDAITRSEQGYAVWVVHPDTVVMLRLSREVGDELGVDAVSGYVQFVHP